MGRGRSSGKVTAVRRRKDREKRVRVRLMYLAHSPFWPNAGHREEAAPILPNKLDTKVVSWIVISISPSLGSASGH